MLKYLHTYRPTLIRPRVKAGCIGVIFNRVASDTRLCLLRMSGGMKPVVPVFLCLKGVFSAGRVAIASVSLSSSLSLSSIGILDFNVISCCSLVERDCRAAAPASRFCRRFTFTLSCSLTGAPGLWKATQLVVVVNKRHHLALLLVGAPPEAQPGQD